MKEYFDQLQVPKFFSEVLSLLAGLNFVFLLSILDVINISHLFIEMAFLSEIMRSVLIVSLAYFCGRYFLLMDTIWAYCVLFFFKREKVGKVKNFYKFIVSLANGDPKNIEKKPHVGYRVDKFIEENEFLKVNRDREYYSGLFIRLSIGGLIALLIINPFGVHSVGFSLAVFVLIVLTVLRLIMQMDTLRLREDIAASEVILRELTQKKS